jgi:hypothetical protein
MSRRVTGDGAPTAKLLFTTAEFRAFVLGVKAGEFDDLADSEALRRSERVSDAATLPGTPDTPCSAVTSDLRARAAVPATPAATPKESP